MVHIRSTKLVLVLTLFSIIVMYVQFTTEISNSRISVQEGILDLSHGNFEKIIIPLNGEWEFYPGEFKLNNFTDPYFIQVPGRWDKLYGDTKQISCKDCGTYRMNLHLPEKGLYCLNIRYISSAYTIFIDQEEIASNGIIGKSELNEYPSWKPRIIPFYADNKEVELVLHVSNYHNNKGGIVNSIILGEYENIFSNYAINVIKSAFIIGVFGGFGIYALLLFHSEGKKKTYLYLGLYCLSALLLESITGSTLIYYIWNDLSFELLSKLQYISYMGVNIALQMILYSMYHQLTSKRRYLLINYINFGYLILIVFTPFSVFGYSDHIYITIFAINCINSIMTLIIAIYKKRKYSSLLLLGVLSMILTIIIDIIYLNNVTTSTSTSSNYILGLFFFFVLSNICFFKRYRVCISNFGESKRHEIAFLQAQIAPHFFYNTLNNVLCMLETSVPQAKELLLNFVIFLRVKHKFDYRVNMFYTFGEELDLIKAYIKIENASYRDLIELVIDVKNEFMDISIPRLLLQPLIENAIRHGFHRDRLLITISAKPVDNQLHIKVQDNGKGMEAALLIRLFEENKIKSGIGLQNVNYRLMKCYHTKLSVQSELTKGTEVVCSIPLEGVV